MATDAAIGHSAEMAAIITVAPPCQGARGHLDSLAAILTKYNGIHIFYIIPPKGVFVKDSK